MTMKRTKTNRIAPYVKLEVLNILHCTECPCVFVNKDKFNTHIREHNNNKALVVSLEKVDIFSCKQCQVAYLHSDKLKKHEATHKNGINNVHTNYEQYKCKDCDKIFASLHDLTIHKVTHLKLKPSTTNNNKTAKIKPFKCLECDAAFVARSTLVAHSILHSPFVNICHCGIGYYKKSDLISHKRLVHETFEKYLGKAKRSKSGVKLDIVYKEDPESDTENEIKEKRRKKRGPKKRQRS